MKREAAWRHMSHIRQDHTAAILVVNVDRPNVPHYIGPNSFAEIGVAFAARRQVFLLQGMPDSYAEELTAWGVTCLDPGRAPAVGRRVRADGHRLVGMAGSPSWRMRVLDGLRHGSRNLRIAAQFDEMFGRSVQHRSQHTVAPEGTQQRPKWQVDS